MAYDRVYRNALTPVTIPNPGLDIISASESNGHPRSLQESNLGSAYLLENIKRMSLEQLAQRMKQVGDTCAVSSMMFAAALLLRDKSYISVNGLEDMKFVLHKYDGYSELEKKIAVKIGKDMPGIITADDVAAYMSKDGYSTQRFQVSEESLAKCSQSRPVIALKFGFPDWVQFFGKGTLKKWYRCHVVCVIGIEGSNVVYFEPLAGEIRRKSLKDLEGLYNGHMVIVQPKVS